MRKKLSILLIISMLISCFSSISVLAYDGAKPLPTRTGIQSEDVAQIAKSQLGYCKNNGTIYGAWWNQVTNWGVDYTNSQWCAMFACWCADQAGAGLNVAFNKSSAKVINLFEFIRKTGSCDTTFQTEPKPGDFIFFKNSNPTLTLPHVAIITDYNSATKEITYVGGNQYLNSTYNSAVTEGHCKWEYGAKPKGESLYVYGYGRPAYSNSQTIPTTPSMEAVITSDKEVYYVGETVILQRNTVPDHDFYCMEVWHNGKQIISGGMETTETLVNLEVGSYVVYLQGESITPGEGIAECSFTVKDMDVDNAVEDLLENGIENAILGSKPVITSDKSVYNLGETVTLQRNTVQNSNFHHIVVWHDGKQILSTGMNETTFTLPNLEAGAYDVYLQVGNAVNEDITMCSFTVKGIDIHNHTDYATNYIFTNPTCVNEGNQIYYCSYCKKNIVKTIPAMGHDFSEEYTILQKATLNSYGNVSFKCLNCEGTMEKYVPKVASIILSKNKYTYNGKKKKPSVTVKDIEGNKLINGTDYSVKYSSGRKNVGCYKVTVTLEGKYSGEKTFDFYIMPKAPKEIKAVVYKNNNVKVSWTKSTGATGYYVYYKESTTDTYTKLCSTKKLAYMKKNLKKGVKYDFKVVPYYMVNEKSCLSENATVTSIVLPKK